MKRQRILLIAGLSDSLINFRGPFIKALSDAGHEVHVAAPNLTEQVMLCTRLREIGATPYSICIERAGMNPVSDLKSLILLCKLIRSVRPNIVLAYTVKPVVWGGLAARFFRDVQYFALITGLGYAFTGNALGRRAVARSFARLLYRVGLARARGVIFQNPDDAKEFAERGLLPSKLQPWIVSGSGVDTERYSVAPLPSGPIRFLLIARLLWDKGVQEYIDAAKLMNKNYPEVECHLVGPIDNSPNAICRAEIDAWVAEGHVTWHGEQEDVRPYIEAAHVYVLPSYREGTPRSVIEAMSMGRPIITTDAPGCRETVIHGVNGFLVPIGDPVALAKSMRKFIESPDLISQMSLQSRKIAEEKYNVRKVNAQMMEAMGL